MLIGLLVPLTLAALVYAWLLFAPAIERRVRPSGEGALLGAVTNFFDTLGIGSMAPTMAWFKLRKLVPDNLSPPTMLVGYTLPTLVQAVIFMVLLGVLVDPVLLAGCAIALIAGGLLGAGLVARTRVWIVQAVVGFALLIAAVFYVLTNLGLMPPGGTATSLPPLETAIAIAANFMFGVLLNFGVGNYAPTLALLSLMGLDPRLVFPIMAVGASLAATGASVRHLASKRIDIGMAVGMTLGAIPAVLVAAFLVKGMPIELLRWLVAAVVFYAAVAMLRSAWLGRQA
jgi:uncharacterized membrane protein YfcA